MVADPEVSSQEESFDVRSSQNSRMVEKKIQNSRIHEKDGIENQALSGMVYMFLPYWFIPICHRRSQDFTICVELKVGVSTQIETHQSTKTSGRIALKVGSTQMTAPN